MGNELSTVGGAIGTVACSVGTVVTFGQVEAVNNATKHCAQFTGKKFMASNVRHVGQLVGEATAVVAVSVASGVCLGQVDALNKTVKDLAIHTGQTAINAGTTLLQTGNDLADGIPIVAHVKGGIHYVCGDKEGGDKAMKSGSRTVGVLAGGVGGMLVGGPVGAIAGGIAGGAAMDGITTGVESAIHQEYRPNGQIAAWTNVAKAKSPSEVTEGVISGLMAPIMDGVGGYAAGKAVAKYDTARLYRVMDETEVQTAVETGKVSPAHNQATAAGETCFSESSTHSRTFIETRTEARGGVPQAVAQVNLKKSTYQSLKDHSIQQRGSRTINQAQINSNQRPFNVTTTEQLSHHPQGKVNINIKGTQNLEILNSGVKKVKFIDPKAINRSGVSKVAHRYGKSGTIETMANGRTKETIDA